MSLKAKIQDDLIAAIKAKNEITVSTLRMLKAAVMKFEVSGSVKKEANDQEVLKIIEKEAKQRKDSIDAFEKAGVTERADQEKKELLVLEGYLPQQMSDEELEVLITQTITQVGATGKNDFGKVMGAVMGKTAGRADGIRVKAIVDKKLGYGGQGGI